MILPLLFAVVATGFRGDGLKPYRHPVMIWISPYGVAKARVQLANPGLQRAVTHLSLQFWVPTRSGTVELIASSGEVSVALIDDLRSWAQAHGIRVMLCVCNAPEEWDWPLAKSAFAANRERFAQSLVDEMTRRRLDGIDIDFEGPDHLGGDKPAYVAFIKTLAKRLHLQGKQLTLDSLADDNSTPDRLWWPELFPFVDALTTMGYDAIGLSGAKAAAYSAQVSAAGKYGTKLQLGVPSGWDKWLGNSSSQQLEWIRRNGNCGIGIWDAGLQGASWRTKALWDIVDRIRVGDTRG